jgi:thioredoxin reductase (NADPH)
MTISSTVLIDQLEWKSNIEVRFRVQVEAVAGGDRLKGLTIVDTFTGTAEAVHAGALFVFLGMAPRTDWLPDLVERNDSGFILSGNDLGPRPRGWTLDRLPLPLETSTPGVFVAGDVRYGSVKRLTAAIADGSMAVRFVYEHLERV